ncbi:S41 family peptidase [Mangrovivirga sp. M17]|uniref:S41 family peptidase n=1 Tax=Mangrovivirga halotolerans TaxID=2993936 RepID=A0ABT3RPP0_9BACT|nr:S41 family peptidase [Mangrovivirga halotolerans]MCX2743308.1 S41 family peptidase [Mangrovivirga halotolerans]
MKFYLILMRIPLVILIILSGCETKNNYLNDLKYSTWKSIGYGRIIEIDSVEYKLYDLTKISCIPVKSGTLSDIQDVIKIKNDTLYYEVGFDIYSFKKIDHTPYICLENEKDSTDPKRNFEVFAQTIKENYAYFDLNNIDWEFIYPVFEEKIAYNTTEEELYLLFDELLDTLKDNHGYIQPSDEVLNQIDSHDDTEEEIGDFAVAKVIAEKYMIKDLTHDSNVVRWGFMADNIGYIQINAMWLHGNLHIPDSIIQSSGYISAYVDEMESISENEILQMEVNGIRQIMNDVMIDLKNTKCIILDVRFNGGGHDDVSLEILRFFNKEKKKIASKRARIGNTFTDELPIFLDKRISPYTNPVIMLTSQQSASATDFLALASLSMENIIRIGSNTQGAISDALEKKLPNGWYFTISNEEYFDLYGNCYENKGIPVDIELNYPEDRQEFFSSLLKAPEKDKQKTLNAVETLLTNNRINVGIFH